MDLLLKEKVAIVSGASRGIGRAIAVALSAEGARVVLVARTVSALNDVARELAADAVVIEADLRDPAAPAKVVQQAVTAFGRLDIVINNAGATQRGDFLELSEEQWQDGFALKFFGAMRMCREAWPHLRAAGGAIVNISGVGGRTGSAEFAVGGAVNAAVLNLTKVLADRGVTDGVRVNAVNPGSTATERLRGRIGRLAAERGIREEEALRETAARLNVARFGDPAEVARAVVFLASPAASYCQGSILDVDGGQTRTL